MTQKGDFIGSANDVFKPFVRGKNEVNILCEVKIMTNYERIKQMSVEEMASYFCIGGLPTCPLNAPHCKDNKCSECFKKWLESEVEDNE